MSPIKGISETKRLPRLGKIHLGVKAKNKQGVEYPTAVDYFVCPEEVQKIFGERPRELRILIPLEDEERWASQYYRCYSKTRGLICKGDGETAVRMVDAKTGAMEDKDSTIVLMKDVPCQGRDCPHYNAQCKEIMNLQFLLPEVPGLGIWQIDTGSINSIRNINATADLIKRIYGRIALIPLLLTIESQEVQDPEGKKRSVYTLNLRTNQTLLELMQTASTKSLTTGEDEPELPISDDEVPDLIIPQNQEPRVVDKVVDIKVEVDASKSTKAKPKDTNRTAKGDDAKSDVTSKKERVEGEFKSISTMREICKHDFAITDDQITAIIGEDNMITMSLYDCYLQIKDVYGDTPRD